MCRPSPTAAADEMEKHLRGPGCIAFVRAKRTRNSASHINDRYVWYFKDRLQPRLAEVADGVLSAGHTARRSLRMLVR
jgi:hypothetical protein